MAKKTTDLVRRSYRDLQKWMSPRALLILLLIANMCIGVETRCSPNTRTCTGTLQCVNYKLWCDGTPDCPYSADEKNCEPKCPKGSEPCTGSYQCLNFRLFCDGFIDCDNGADEANCDADRICRGKYCCADPVDPELEPYRLCQGRETCPDASDDWFCDDDITCPRGSIKCPSNRQCLPIKRICIHCDHPNLVKYCKKAAAKFKAYPKELSYPMAAEACKELDGRLATPKNLDDYNGIQTAAYTADIRTNNKWIGIKRTDENQWSYEDGTEVGTWNAWFPGHPKWMGDCVRDDWNSVLKIHGWNDGPCDQKEYYVCEFGSGTGSDGENLQASPMMLMAAILTCLLLNA